MRKKFAIFTAALLASLVVPLHGPPGALAASTPSWAQPGVDYLVGEGWLRRSSFEPNEFMTRRAFKRLMSRAFGGGYERTRGKVTAGEVDYALVRALGYGPLALQLQMTQSGDGWNPKLGQWFGSEIVARHLGLRHDRSTAEEAYEASAGERIRQAEIAYAVWQAKTSPNTWTLDELSTFSLANYSATKRKVVQWALSLVGKPYVYSGEWATTPPEGYPYGPEDHGGFDCSGFAWYVLRRSSTGWDPPGRPYAGWSLPERSSSDMAGAASPRVSFSNLRPLDVMFFGSSGSSTVSHAGIYLGKKWMVHSSNSSAGVSIDYLGAGEYYRENFLWARRII